MSVGTFGQVNKYHCIMCLNAQVKWRIKFVFVLQNTGKMYKYSVFKGNNKFKGFLVIIIWPKTNIVFEYLKLS